MAMAGLGVTLSPAEEWRPLTPKMPTEVRAGLRARWEAAVRQGMG